MTALTLSKGTTSRLALASLRDLDGIAITDATVTATIYDTSGVAVAGQVWPTTLAHDASGTYYATIKADVDVEVGRKYFAEILAVSGPSQKTWRCPVSVVYAC